MVCRQQIHSRQDGQVLPRVGPTFDLDAAIDAHEATMGYAVRLWETSSTQSVARTALALLVHDAVCLHRAILVLGGAGWAFATPILARAMLDLSHSAQVIVHAPQPDVAAFEWLYAFAKDEIYRSSPDVQKAIAAALAQMNPTHRKQAEAFLASPKIGAYWYSKRFKSPRAIIRAFGTGALQETWKFLSSSAHGGYMGMRLFRLDPFHLDINPREDASKAAMGIIQSIKLLNDLLRTWERFVGGQGPEYATIKKLIIKAMALKPI